jgi:hypothetical protein
MRRAEHQAAFVAFLQITVMALDGEKNIVSNKDLATQNGNPVGDIPFFP